MQLSEVHLMNKNPRIPQGALALESDAHHFVLRLERVLSHAPQPAVLLVYSITTLFLQFYLAWWIFVLPAFVLGFLSHHPILKKRAAPRNQRRLIAGCTALVWILMCLVRDFETHWRIAPRLSGLFQIPSRVGIYLILATVVFLLSGIAANLGRASRYYLRRVIDA